MTQAFVAQTSIANTLTRGFAGMLADSGRKRSGSGKASSRRDVTVTPSAVNSAHYIVTITQNGASAAYDYTADGSATVAEITAGLLALINAGTQSVVEVDNTTTMTIKATGDGAKADFSVTYNANMTEAVVQTANMALPYGFFVCKDDISDAGDLRLPNVAADVTGTRAAGFVMADNYTRVTGNGSVPANCMVNVLKAGRILAVCDAIFKDGDPVYIRYSAGGNGIGSLSNASGSGLALLPNAKISNDGAAGDLAVVDVNLPG